MSCFIAQKLDTLSRQTHTSIVKKNLTKTRRSGRVTAVISRRIESEGERLWRPQDFADLPPSAVLQALSRLTRRGRLERLSKGVYYSTRQTAFGAFSLPASPPPIFSDSRRRRRAEARFPPAPSAYPANSSAATPSFIPADRKHGPDSPRAMRHCSISCATPDGQASSRRTKPSAVPSHSSRKTDASSD